MGRKKGNGDKGAKDEKKAPVTIAVKDEDGAEYKLRPLHPNTDVDFYKIYISRFSKTLDSVMNQKMKLVLWLIKKMSLTNELKYSYREIATLSGISYQTVADTMKALIEDDFIRRNGKTLMVNPNAVFRGRLDRKAAALNQYSMLRQPPKKRKKGQAKKEQADAPEKKQKPEKELKKIPLSLKDRQDLERELEEIRKDISELEKWRYNLMCQHLFENETDENRELKKIAEDIEKCRERLKYLSRLLFAADLPEEDDDGEDGDTQTEEEES